MSWRDVSLATLHRLGFTTPDGWTVGDLIGYMENLPAEVLRDADRRRQAMLSIGLHPPARVATPPR